MSDELENRVAWEDEPFPKGLTAQEWMDWCPFALREIKRLTDELEASQHLRAVEVEVDEAMRYQRDCAIGFALQRDSLKAELASLRARPQEPGGERGAGRWRCHSCAATNNQCAALSDEGGGPCCDLCDHDPAPQEPGLSKEWLDEVIVRKEAPAPSTPGYCFHGLLMSEWCYACVRDMRDAILSAPSGPLSDPDGDLISKRLLIDALKHKDLVVRDDTDERFDFVYLESALLAIATLPSLRGPLSDEPRELEWRTKGRIEKAEGNDTEFEVTHLKFSDVLEFTGPNCRGQIESQITREWPKSLAASLQSILDGRPL